MNSLFVPGENGGKLAIPGSSAYKRPSNMELNRSRMNLQVMEETRKSKMAGKYKLICAILSGALIITVVVVAIVVTNMKEGEVVSEGK